MVGVSKSPFNPFPTDVIKSAVDICEFWLSFEKSELFDIPSLNSNFMVNNENNKRTSPIQTNLQTTTTHTDPTATTTTTTALIFIIITKQLAG